MKKKMKQILALLLALMMLCGACFFFAAAEEQETPGTDLENPIDDPNEDPAEEPAEGTAVARLYLCARVAFLGHVWIYVKNLSDAPIKVGCYEVPVGSGVSVGTHSLRRADGAGVYYNVEAYMIHKLGSSSGVSRSMDLNAEQLKTVSRSILTHNSWSLSNNCGHFATRVWNSVSSRKVHASFLPLTVKSRIGNGGGPKMISPSRSHVYRQRGSGSSAHLSKVSDRSLIFGIG